MTDAPATREHPWPVALLSAKLKDYLDRLGTVWVEGEITQWGVSGGNVYGKLKDLEADATLSFTMWSSVRARLSEQFKQGDHAILLVKPSWWVKGGSLSMQVYDMKHVGLGDLLERLERLRVQLAAEGLFDPGRRKPLPFLPAVVGLVTGRDSDAEQDVLRNARLRWPAVEFRTAYASVQGDRTAPEVVAAIRRLDADPEVEVIIVARGGGDFQNLLGFSDERVVRAAAAASTPIVSAIGHEADRPLLDDVADLRASTPTDAAKRVVPDVAEELERIGHLRHRARRCLGGRLDHETAWLTAVRSRPALAQPTRELERRAAELSAYADRARRAVATCLDRGADELAHLRARVAALSPAATLERGYAVVRDSGGAVVRDPAEVSAGDPLLIRVARGEIPATVSDGGSSPGTAGP